MAAKEGIEAGFVDELLALRTPEQQAGFLLEMGMLDAGGLERLLDAAEVFLNTDPDKARMLVECCVAAAESADAPAAVPRANYILQQVYEIRGDFRTKLRLIEVAHDGYAALGMNLPALRTNVGKMVALLELGRYEEALEAGQTVLDALDGKGELPLDPTPEASDLLTALVQQNRGGCLEYMGRYDEALDAYAEAEQRYGSLGMTERVGEILDNRSAILLHLGRGNEALRESEAAAAIFEKAGLTLAFAKALANIGHTNLRLGNYARSLRSFEQTSRLLDSLDARLDKGLLLRDKANAYLDLNLYSEALATYRQAEILLRASGMVHDRAEVLWGIGSALIARSELEEAEAALAEAAALFEEAGNSALLSGVMLEQASLQAVRGDREGALSTARRSLSLASEGDWPVQKIYAHLSIADLLLPDAAEAEPHLLEAARLAEPLGHPQLRYRLDERLGYLRILQGRRAEARELLERAVEDIERLRGTVTQQGIRASFLRDKTAAYEHLLMLYLSRNEEESTGLAFNVAERAKSRALVDLLTGVAEKELVGREDGGLGERIRVLQADLNAVYGGLLGGVGDEDRPAALPNLHTRAIELEQEISQLRLQHAAAGRDPDPFSATVPPDDVREGLAPDTTLLAYHVVGDEVLAFVNAKGQTWVARHLGTVTEVERLLRKLDIQWDRFRADRGFAGRHMATLERSARQVLGALYEELVASLDPLLKEATPAFDETGCARKLSIVPHGPLHRVPFHALFDGARYLIDEFEISYAPSATVYALCQQRRPIDQNGTVVFGVDDPQIPAALSEARAVARRLPDAKIYVGDAATLGAVRDEASSSSIVHLACHGLFRSDNPMFSALKLHDGWLTAADAMALDLPGTLVTLSACESGRGEVIGGDEVLGLTRAFLGAGAATLVVSLWLVQDETTAGLMTDWYELLRGGGERAATLRAAQLKLKERYPHPYYWAPFVLIGKR